MRTDFKMLLYSEYFTCTGPITPGITYSYLSATSVTIFWDEPPKFSLPIISYTLFMTRIEGSTQTLCPSVADRKSAVNTTSIATYFTNLEEFSSYMVTLQAIFRDVSMSGVKRVSTLSFKTLSAGIFSETCGIIKHVYFTKYTSPILFEKPATNQ